MMTKQDYEAIVAVLGDHSTGPDYETTRSIALALADMMAKGNPRFDQDRFLRAAGVR